MGRIETELCAYSVWACRVAERCGVTRAELCAGPAEGGITPSAATIRMARRAAADIRLHVMIRPRGGDFLYDDTEFEQMRQDIRYVRSCGADGVVLGLLTPDGVVDVQRTRELVAEAEDMDVTFHRAFDMTRDMGEALEDVISTGCSRILTSGGCNRAAEGVENLRRLTVQAAGRIGIMAGSGVNAGNAAEIAAAGVDAIHFSARRLYDSRMQFRNPSVSMGGCEAVPEYGMYDADTDVVRAIMESCRRLR